MLIRIRVLCTLAVLKFPNLERTPNITKRVRSSLGNSDYRGGAAAMTLLRPREVSIFALVQTASSQHRFWSSSGFQDEDIDVHLVRCLFLNLLCHTLDW